MKITWTITLAFAVNFITPSSALSFGFDCVFLPSFSYTASVASDEFLKQNKVYTTGISIRDIKEGANGVLTGHLEEASGFKETVISSRNYIEGDSDKVYSFNFVGQGGLSGTRTAFISFTQKSDGGIIRPTILYKRIWTGFFGSEQLRMDFMLGMCNVVGRR